MSYVDAGYVIALGTLFVYAVGLGLRRRRWARAWRTSQRQERGSGDVAAPRDNRS